MTAGAMDAMRHGWAKLTGDDKARRGGGGLWGRTGQGELVSAV
jgi:hypothetical protein